MNFQALLAEVLHALQCIKTKLVKHSLYMFVLYMYAKVKAPVWVSSGHTSLFNAGQINS